MRQTANRSVSPFAGRATRYKVRTSKKAGKAKGQSGGRASAKKVGKKKTKATKKKTKAPGVPKKIGTKGAGRKSTRQRPRG